MKIDLGVTPSKGEPSLSAPVSVGDSGPPYYPSLYMSFPDSRLDGLPEEGTITFRYKTVATTESERNGKESCSVELELRKIVAVSEAGKPKPGYETRSIGEALAELKSGGSDDAD